MQQIARSFIINNSIKINNFKKMHMHIDCLRFDTFCDNLENLLMFILFN